MQATGQAKTSAAIGDAVDIRWRETDRRDRGTVETVLPMVVRVRIAGPPEITVTVPADALAEAGDRRWELDL